MTQQEAIIQIIHEQQQQQQEMIIQIIKELQKNPKPLKTLRRKKTTENNESNDFIPNMVLTTLKTSSRMSEPQNTYITPKKPLTTKIYAKKPNTVIEAAKHNKQLRTINTTISRNLQILTAERDEALNEKMSLLRRIEKIDKTATDVQDFSNKLEQLEAKRKKSHFWNWIQKPKLDKEIEQARVDYRSALYYFGQNYHINPKDISEKIERMQEKIKDAEAKIAKKNTQISILAEKHAAVKQEYAKHKFRISKKSLQQLDYFVEPSHITGFKQSVMGFMQELRKEAEKQKRRKKITEIKRAIKPKRMLMITSPTQKKRRLADVIGKRYQRTAEDIRPISSLPIKENMAVS